MPEGGFGASLSIKMFDTKVFLFPSVIGKVLQKKNGDGLTKAFALQMSAGHWVCCLMLTPLFLLLPAQQVVGFVLPTSEVSESFYLEKGNKSHFRGYGKGDFKDFIHAEG